MFVSGACCGPIRTETKRQIKSWYGGMPQTIMKGGNIVNE